jgi:nucleosome binding factor SPN SPT16 subunit
LILGVITKESPTGKLVNEWQKALEESSKEIEKTDVSVGMAMLFAAKDKEELVVELLKLGKYPYGCQSYVSDYEKLFRRSCHKLD